MGINLMADLGFDEDSDEVKQARGAAEMYAEVMDELVTCRDAAGLTQKQVAKRMGTSQSAVSELESVSSDARFSTIIRYVQAIGCDLVIELSQPGDVQEDPWVHVQMTEHAKVIPLTSARYHRVAERETHLQFSAR